MNASDLLDESNSDIFSMEIPMEKSIKHFKKFFFIQCLAPEFLEEDDKSSIYSHPDGPIIHNLRPNFSGILSSTPENFALSASEFVPNVELSTEVFLLNNIFLLIKIARLLYIEKDLVFDELLKTVVPKMENLQVIQLTNRRIFAHEVNRLTKPSIQKNFLLFRVSMNH